MRNININLILRITFHALMVLSLFMDGELLHGFLMQSAIKSAHLRAFTPLQAREIYNQYTIVKILIKR